MSARERMREDTRTAELVVGEEKSVEDLQRLRQEDRERRIAEAHEIVGRIQGLRMVSEFADVSNLMWLKGVKETKLYRDLPGIGTWEQFCERIGVSRQKVDEDLSNLNVFGERFLTTVGSFQVGYRELRRLRHAAADGTLLIEGETVQIGDERIPLTPDHREDLQLALEQLLDAKQQILDEKDATLRAKDKVLEAKEDVIQRQEKELARLEKEAEGKGLTASEDAFLQRMEVLRTTFDGVMVGLDPERIPELADEAEPPTPRMVAAYLTSLDYLRKQILAAYDTAMDVHGSPAIAPEEGWSPPEDDEAHRIDA